MRAGGLFFSNEDRGWNLAAFDRGFVSGCIASVPELKK